MSEASKFHPEIEKALVTSGDDIGRVKDVELAHGIANAENAARESEFPLSEKALEEHTSKYVKVSIAERAVADALQIDIHNIAVSGALNEPLPYDFHVQGLVDKAARVGDDYDKLEQLSRAAKEAREHSA